MHPGDGDCVDAEFQGTLVGKLSAVAGSSVLGCNIRRAAPTAYRATFDHINTIEPRDFRNASAAAFAPRR